jgi:tetratricopeptide (TPR) repeat protein
MNLSIAHFKHWRLVGWISAAFLIGAGIGSSGTFLVFPKYQLARAEMLQLEAYQMQDKGDLDAAEFFATQATAIYPEHYGAYFALGTFYEAQGKTVKAREMYLMALQRLNESQAGSGPKFSEKQIAVDRYLLQERLGILSK